MDSIPVFVGLDYHDASVQACVMNTEGAILGNRSCPNERDEIIRYVEQFGCVVRAGIEACTGSADLAEELVQHGWSVDLAHPGYVSRMRQSPDKHDWGDARLLADLERVGYLPRVWLAPRRRVSSVAWFAIARPWSANAARCVSGFGLFCVSTVSTVRAIPGHVSGWHGLPGASWVSRAGGSWMPSWPVSSG